MYKSVNCATSEAFVASNQRVSSERSSADKAAVEGGSTAMGAALDVAEGAAVTWEAAEDVAALTRKAESP
jgi:hypothetical protein